MLRFFYLFQQVGIAAIFHAYTFLFVLLEIALPLNVWDILVAEQPSSEEWHIAIQSVFVE
jgi:hypothetical protein